MIAINQIHTIDCLNGLRLLPDCSVQCCITSPPYWKLRNYGIEGQLGNEPTPEEYVATLVTIFAEVKRVLEPDGTLWLNLGDMYWGSGKAGKNPDYWKRHTEFSKSSKNSSRFGSPTTGKHLEIKNKDLIGFPWMVAFALRQQGWFLRQDIIWNKPNCMPESVTDRCGRTHEYIFLLSKSQQYYFDHEAIKMPAKGKSVHDRTSRTSGKGVNDALDNKFRKQRGPYDMVNRRSVWTITNKPLKEADFAAFPREIPELCVLAGTKVGDLVLDPFMGSGTTALAAIKLKRNYIGFELNPEYVAIANRRITDEIINREQEAKSINHGRRSRKSSASIQKS